MSEINRHGLSRKIPADVKRQVRQECGFGCVICGKIPYEYEHFDPEFNDATSHEVERIALLCPDDHTERTAGRLAQSTVAKYRKNPSAIQTGTAWYKRPKFFGETVQFQVGGTVFSGTRCRLDLAGHTLFGISAPADAGLPWTFDGDLHANEGKSILKFHEDELQLSIDSWDVRLEGKSLEIRRGHGDIVARVEFDANGKTIRLSRLLLEYRSGLTVEVDNHSIEIRNLHHTGYENTMDRFRLEASKVHGVPNAISPSGVPFSIRGGRRTRVGSIVERDILTVGANGVADLSAVMNLQDFLSPDQLA